MPNELITNKQFMEELSERWTKNCLAENLEPLQTLIEILQYNDMIEHKDLSNSKILNND